MNIETRQRAELLLNKIQPLSVETQRKAVRAVLSAAHNSRDAAELLAALGLVEITEGMRDARP